MMFAGLTNHIFWWMEHVEETQEEKPFTSTEDTITTVRYEKEKSNIKKETEEKELTVCTNDTKQAGATGDSSESSITESEKDTGISQMKDAITTGSPQLEPFQAAEEKDSANDACPAEISESVPQSISESKRGHENDQTPEVNIGASEAVGSFKSFFYSAFKKAEQTLAEASVKIKETVVNNNILGQFDEEQNAFIRSKIGNVATALPPWVGCPNEETLREEILSLSADRRNFVRHPPTGVDFQFDYEVSHLIAMSILEQDPELEKMRYDLVPKVVSEQEFWRNYFYRLSLVCQANELSVSHMEGDGQCVEKNHLSTEQTVAKERTYMDAFVSDVFRVGGNDSIDQKKMDTLALSTESIDTEWEKELRAELQDYGLRGERNITNVGDDDLDEEIEIFLREDTDAK